MTLLIKDLSNDDKPRERLLLKGPEALSDSELLALIIGSGGKNASAIEVSSQLIKQFGSLKGVLEANLRQLVNKRHIGIAKAVAIKAVAEIAKKAYLSRDIPKITVSTPHDAFNYIKKELFGKTQERLYLINLDTRKKVVSKELISLGSINETLIPVREILQKALLSNAVNIILVHNHPSNDPTPSKEDILVTEKLAKACKVVGISLLDHIITADNDYVSLKSLDIFQSDKLIKEGR